MVQCGSRPLERVSVCLAAWRLGGSLCDQIPATDFFFLSFAVESLGGLHTKLPYLLTCNTLLTGHSRCGTLIACGRRYQMFIIIKVQ